MGCFDVLFRWESFSALARMFELPCLELDTFLCICAEECLALDVGRLLNSTLSPGASTLFILVSKRAGCGDSSRFMGAVGAADLPRPSILAVADGVFFSCL